MTGPVFVFVFVSVEVSATGKETRTHLSIEALERKFWDCSCELFDVHLKGHWKKQDWHAEEAFETHLDTSNLNHTESKQE